jgi:hypothetical protein
VVLQVVRNTRSYVPVSPVHSAILLRISERDLLQQHLSTQTRLFVVHCCLASWHFSTLVHSLITTQFAY